MHVNLLGDRQDRLATGWTREEVTSLLGDLSLDATAAPGPGATVRFVALAGDAKIRVPPGSRVTAGGFTLWGDRKIDVTPGDGPEIAVRVYSLFGDLKVTDRLDAD